MTLKISISGVRGTVPDSLTPEVCLDFAKAFGSYLHDRANKTVVIGTDPRHSSEYIKGIVFSGLLATGCKVIDLGICPTPTVGLMVRELKADGGVIITASHNPLPWNGLKFVRNDGIFLNEEQARKLIKLYETKAFVSASPNNIISDHSGIDRHINKVMKVIKPRQAHLRVALDCCNGAGSIATVKLLQKLGCTIVAINCNVTRPFPHPPEPVAANLKELIKAVKDYRADIGFALDSDADRLAIVSEEGKPIGEELTLALAVKYILTRHRNDPPKNKIVVTNLSTTQALDDIVRENNGTLIRTKIGEVHVAEKLKELNGLIGGEGNGGVIYPAVGFNRDSLAAIALIMDYLVTAGRSVSELVADIPAYYMAKTKIECRQQSQVKKMIARVKAKFKKYKLILTDGVKVLLPAGWIHVRASNTEPIIRVIAEGKSKKEVAKLIKQVV
ncbi:MAG: phosphoglucosamine mutase [Candidatus Margulisbacteria bacterium]|nr:phosphoglucosamine mutase [Candidatus Margulisiibacteriota bacterium]